jgi:hypothetical protein
MKKRKKEQVKTMVEEIERGSRWRREGFSRLKRDMA